MLQAIAAAVLCGSAVILLVFSWKRSDRSLMWTSLFVGLSLLLHVHVVFAYVDSFIGGRNLTDLLSRILILIGCFFLSRAITRAAHPGKKLSMPYPATLVLFIAALCLCFSAIETSGTEPAFMATFGDQPAAALYSSLEMAYMAIAVTQVVIAASRYSSKMSSRVLQVSFRAVTAGGVLLLVLAVVTIVMNYSHVAGRMGLVAALGVAYAPIYLAAIALISIGSAAPGAIRASARFIAHRNARRYVPLLEEIWRQVGGEKHKLTLSQKMSSGDSSSAVMHRLLIEIEDAFFLNPSARDKLTNSQRSTLSASEAFLRGASVGVLQ